METKGKIAVKLEELDLEDVLSLLQKWDMEEFDDFVKEKELDGRKLMEVTEGIVKVWRPKSDAKKFLLFLHDVKENPNKYLSNLQKSRSGIIKISKETNICPESQYQTVTVRKTMEEANVNSVEEILKKIVPAKSFLYRNQQKRDEKAVTSYLPMDAGTPKKKWFFRLSSYEYPFFDIRLRFSKTDNNIDRGYYSVKSNNRCCMQKSYKRQEVKTKYKSLPTPEQTNDNIHDDHFYEDLNYNEITKINDINQEEPRGQVSQVKPCMVKIQELFQSFKLPFFRKSEEVLERERKFVKEAEKEGNIYENNDSILDMYDSIHEVNEDTKSESKEEKNTLPVEDYLEPVQLNKDYCDVTVKQKEESLMGYILSYFENRFGFRRETNDGTLSEESETDSKECEDKWNAKMPGGSMAARPLPVPIENEPFYMNVDRSEAENLLRGQPDGTFVLRPSSQPNHAYTLSVSCGNAVHNVGVRRRPDGRLALGFARRGERSFSSVTSLLRHHRRRRLLLVAAGDVIGATTLNETPHYYQTPSNVPVLHV
ncbi:unnamed protein product [Parnassius mnemosyne]|uniref:SH2 domain-containing protein n=1 Tax=Parnassius mnemosyne TaxID=213953 RepID=A0AAV1LHC6_9NEOP